ncbi:class I SAM-dependent methyltransferase [Actinoallomurus sp. CA-150999]|uniref:class I SAM-dependent methyltransferase n=1 Tax=Actinoallomurus sp. CA-150999 TaxID=3239887 RepID=UPI003D8D3B39
MSSTWKRLVDGSDGGDDIKQAIVALWDGLAGDYDSAWAHGLKTGREKRAWSDLLTRLLPLDPPLRILDVGCGTGFLSLLLAEAGHAVVGLDLSEPMLEVARRAATDRSLPVEFVQGDAENPTRSLGGFDAVVSRHLLWTLPSPQQGLLAWIGLLSPGGRVLAIDGFWSSKRVTDKAMAATGRVLRRLADGRQHGDNDYEPEVAARLPLRDLTELAPVRELFTASGLVDVATEPLTTIDRVERSVMPVRYRLALRHRRYLVHGRLPADGPELSKLRQAPR